MSVPAAGPDWRDLSEPARSEAWRQSLARRLAASDWVGLTAAMADTSAVVEYACRFGFADVYALVHEAARCTPELTPQRTLFEALDRFLRWRIDRLTIDPEAYPTEIANEFVPVLPPELAASWEMAQGDSHGPVRLRKLSGPPTVGAVGHTASVNQVAFSPTGDLFATASDDGSVKVWTPFAETPTAACFGHPDKVTCVTFSPDGSRLASADTDGIVNIWDPTSGQLLANCCGHTERVNRILFSPDGQTLASCSRDRTVKIWDANGGALRSDLVHAAEVNAIAFSPDKRLLASGCGCKGAACDEQEDTAVRVWDLATGRVRLVLRGHSAPVNDLVFVPGTGLLASGGGQQWSDRADDRTVRVWGLETGEAVRTLHGHTGAVTRLIAVNGYLCSGARDGTVRVWDVRTGEGVRVLSAGSEDDGVRGLAANSQGTILFAGGTSKTVRAWDTTSWDLRWESEPVSAYVNSVACSPDGRFVIWGEIHSAVRLRTIADQPVARIDHETTPRTDIAFFADGHRAVEVVDGRARVVDIDSGRILTACDSVPGNATEITAAAGDELIMLLDLVDRLGGYPISAVSAVAVSSDGTRIAGGTFCGRVIVWDADTGDILAARPVHAAIIRAIAFSPEGDAILTGGHDARVCLLDLKLDEIASAAGEGWFSNAVAFHPSSTSGHHIVAHSISPSDECYSWGPAASGDIHLAADQAVTRVPTETSPDVGAAKQCSAARLEPSQDEPELKPADKIALAVTEQWYSVKSYAAHAGAIFALVFSPDGRLLASASDDHGVKVWRVADGKLVTEGRHRGRIDALAFSSDGSILASGGRDCVVRLWDATTGACMNAAFFDEAFLRVAASGGEGNVEILVGTLTGRLLRYRCHSDAPQMAYPTATPPREAG